MWISGEGEAILARFEATRLKVAEEYMDVFSKLAKNVRRKLNHKYTILNFILSDKHDGH